MTCQRLWEVEASRDGRLTGEALAQFERHMARCVTCAREAGRLAALAGALRANTGPPLDELTLERMRSRTLALADRTLTRPGTPRKRAFRVAMVASAIAVAPIALGVTLRIRHLHELRAPAPLLKVVPVDQARWRSWRYGASEHVKLDEGTLQIAVSRRPGDPRVVVDVPDGVIEDRGTRFVVEVRDARTTAIRVEEGAVEFRRNGASPLALGAGMNWSPSPVAAVGRAPAPDPREALTARASQRHAASDAHTPPAATPRQPTQRTERDVGPAANAPVPEPSASGATAEDLAYLRIVALLREGRRDEARVAAQDYLRRFPGGFRRVEVESIAQ